MSSPTEFTSSSCQYIKIGQYGKACGQHWCLINNKSHALGAFRQGRCKELIDSYFLCRGKRGSTGV
jgi:hypothetical protein